MNYIDGYFKEDLTVFYKCCDEDDEKNDKLSTPFSENIYYILYIIKGSASVKKGSSFFDVIENEMILVDINTFFMYRFNKDKRFEYLLIRIHPSVFGQTDDPMFLRPFQSEFNKDTTIINLSNRLYSNIQICMNMISDCIKLQLGRAHILPRIKTVISDLCIIYDKEFATENKSTDSIPARVIDYINRHYLDDISYSDIQKRYFISKTTVISIVHKYTKVCLDKQMALMEYVHYMRLRDANSMLERGWSVHKVSELCGYTSYSTFFRAYKKIYGVSPVTNKNVRKKKWPMTK